MSTELGIRDVAFEVDDLQAAIDRVAADGNGRKTRLVMRVLPRLPSDCRFSLGGRPECRTATGTLLPLSRNFAAKQHKVGRKKETAQGAS
jgi:hypothetical protein